MKLLVDLLSLKLFIQIGSQYESKSLGKLINGDFYNLRGKRLSLVVLQHWEDYILLLYCMH